MEESFNYSTNDATRFVDELKDRVHDLYDENHKLKEEIERLNNRLKTSNDTCNYLRNTIDKAIEYIDRRDIEWGSEEHNILLSILKGSDKE